MGRDADIPALLERRDLVQHARPERAGAGIAHRGALGGDLVGGEGEGGLQRGGTNARAPSSTPAVSSRRWATRSTGLASPSPRLSSNGWGTGVPAPPFPSTEV
jgi:hypothetical protein